MCLGAGLKGVQGDGPEELGAGWQVLDEQGVSEVCVGGLQGHVCEAAAHVMGRTGVPGGPRALARCDVRVSTFPEGLWGALQACGLDLEPRDYLHNAHLHGTHLHNPVTSRTRVGGVRMV